MSASNDHPGAGPIPPSLRRELDRARQEIVRLRSANRQFVTDTVHDLRSPLAATIGAVELLADADGLSAFQRRELLEMTRRALGRLRSAMDELLSQHDTQSVPAGGRSSVEPR